MKQFIGALIVFTLIAALVPASAAAAGKGDRSKVIDFEGELVEGMNKRPLDSLSQISEADKKRNRPHLYQVRRGFRHETRELLRELRHAQN